MVRVQDSVDEELGHRSYVIDLGEGTATSVFDRGPDTWTDETGQDLEFES